MKSKSKLFSILFWSIISAAFIGPGTITTCAKSGTVYQYDLLWALVFSTIACIVLQEACARITMTSGMNLGQAISKSFEYKSTKLFIQIWVSGAIIVGSAAYQTGNILGASVGLGLVFTISPQILILLIALAAFIILNIPSLKIIANVLGCMVLFMGLAFFGTALMLKPDAGKLLQGSLIPQFPSDSLLLIMGLIGTTVVPYNLFLGSGISDKKQSLADMRFGLAVAIGLGGLISMAVLVVGTAISGEFSYQKLSEALSLRLGGWAVYLFALGMFAAGFSSAITAPLASAITARSLFGNQNPERWLESSLNFKTIWGFVWVCGLFFSLMNIQPIPVIILAQALNGVVLPFVSIFLVFVMNDARLMQKEKLNSLISNTLMAFVVWVTLLLGLISILKAVQTTLKLGNLQNETAYLLLGIISVLISVWVWFRVYFLRR